MRVLVTGARGNLGSKLVPYLCGQEWCTGVVGVDTRPASAPSGASPRLISAVADLANPVDSRWLDLLPGRDAVVHFATGNSMPDCSWAEATGSLAMTLALLDAAAAAGVARFVFASSNHVMGGYKDPPLSAGLTAGSLTTDLPVAPGTSTHKNGVTSRPVAYATSKLYGEQAAATTALATRGRLTSVAVRIGWCQPGRNDPATINAFGWPMDTPPAPPTNPREVADLAWFQGIWLSNGDFIHLMECAIRADASAWPGPAIVVNGVSNNRGTVWDLEATRRLIGYAPKDGF